MNRRGYDPTRRNRNIGTAKAGHGQDNRLVIPGHWADLRSFYEKFDDPVVVRVAAGGKAMWVLVEPPLPGFVHACTIDDILYVLSGVPARHFKDIWVIVLRQPKRKQRILRSVWGRMTYFSDLKGYSGPAIYLEAQDLRKPLRWSKSLGPDEARELERLREDGHEITTGRRHHAIASTLDAVRSTQLFRTLPHEIGHYVDFLEKVVEPSRDEADWNRREERYHSRPVKEKEDFAHRYANELRDRQVDAGEWPFARIWSPSGLRRRGLSPEWFAAPGSST